MATLPPIHRTPLPTMEENWKPVHALCFRGDDRSPDDIFENGFSNRNHISNVTPGEVKVALNDIAKKVSKKLHTPIVRNPRTGERLSMPFSPVSDAGLDYITRREDLLFGQPVEFRDYPTMRGGILRPPQYDLNAETGVAVTYRMDLAPIFPLKTAAMVQSASWVYAVWIDMAFMTYELQEEHRPAIADAYEIAVRFIPRSNVIAAVPCVRDGGPLPQPITYRVLAKEHEDIRWNKHGGNELRHEVKKTFEPYYARKIRLIQTGAGFATEYVLDF